jgi:hypothetical protein
VSRSTAEGRRLANDAVAVVEACDKAFFAALPDPAGFVSALRALAATKVQLA